MATRGVKAEPRARPAGKQVLWYLMPGGMPERAADAGAKARQATHWCYEGAADGWKPIDTLELRDEGGAL